MAEQIGKDRGAVSRDRSERRHEQDEMVPRELPLAPYDREGENKPRECEERLGGSPPPQKMDEPDCGKHPDRRIHPDEMGDLTSRCRQEVLVASNLPRVVPGVHGHRIPELAQPAFRMEVGRDDSERHHEADEKPDRAAP